MKKKTTQVSSLKVIEGGNVDEVESVKSLTHKDIKRFLANFAEAIFVDQERVNKLSRKICHPDYDAGMWKRNREDHVSALVDLSVTVDDMPKRLLRRLTDFAVAYQPGVVNQPLLNIISDLATGVSSPELYETATMFFDELIKDVGQRDPGVSPKGTPTEIMAKWFDYDDPIAIAEDPECEYFDSLASLIRRESENTKNKLSVRGKIAFIEQRVAKEFFDDMTLRPDRS